MIRMKNEYKKDIIYVSLVSQFDKVRCPICNRLKEIEYNEIYNFLYENVNNPHIRKN